MAKRPDIETIGHLVRAVAVAEIMPHWRTLGPDEIATKSGPGDLVTVADRKAEAALSRALLQLYPGSRITGEETFAADPSCLQHHGGEAPVWVIDPIDGTGAFTRGEADFALMLALVHGQSLDAAWILQPVSGDLYLAERGSGVRHISAEGTLTALGPAPPHDPSAMTGIVSGSVFLDGRRVLRAQHRDQFLQLRYMTCPGMDYPAVLRGEAHFTVYGKCLPWDHLPGLMMLREVGWTFAKLDGTAYRVGDRDGGVMSAPSPAAWTAIRQVLATPRPVVQT
jgi:fructose-1,6-bisphosphatase/inositol monophosphatase family enzyme